MSFRQAAAVVLPAMFAYTLYLTSMVHQMQVETVANPVLDRLLAEVTTGSNFTLRRAPEAVQLEKRVDADPMLGVCDHGKPILEGLREDICQDLDCLWVKSLDMNIDVSETLLTVYPGPEEMGCDQPRGGQLPVPAGQQPHISFILTLHNNASLTTKCLLELFRTAREVPSAEYVIVDDGSTEDIAILLQTVWRLREVFKVLIKFQRNEEALGYGQANAVGVGLSEGKYIAFINNDMFVARGWLAAIMRTFEQNPKAGMVGPMFMGKGDLITEAGGLIFSDGSAWHYATGKEPYFEMYYMRKADYISAACVVLLRDTYKQAGGFDAQYQKGYYEDTDLAFAVRSMGMDVLFQPLAVVYHQEGGTFGFESDLQKQLMLDNKVKFYTKWNTVLQEKHCFLDLSVENFVVVNQQRAAERLAYPRFLWIDDIVPEPDRDAGSVRNLKLLRILLDAGYHVTFIPTAPGREPHYTTQLRHMGVQTYPTIPPGNWVLARNGKCAFDVIMIARVEIFDMVQSHIEAHCKGVPLVFDTVYLHFLQNARDHLTELNAEKTLAWQFDELTVGKALNWTDSNAVDALDVKRTRHKELEAIDKSDLTLVLGPQEVDLIHRYRRDAEVAVVSSMYDVDSLHKTSCYGRAGMLFVGNMNHIPNRQAAETLIRDVLPWTLRMLPEGLLEKFKLHIVGANIVSEELKDLFRRNRNFVKFHGHLNDTQLARLYATVRVAAAPLLSGAGVKGKVAQGWQYGVPVVATPMAVEGMFAQNGVDSLVASSPKEFAKGVAELHKDCTLWQRLVAGGRQTLREHFSVEAGRASLLEALRRIDRGPLPETLRGSCKAAAAVMQHAAQE